jgi:hypothetical protein
MRRRACGGDGQAAPLACCECISFKEVSDMSEGNLSDADRILHNDEPTRERRAAPSPRPVDGAPAEAGGGHGGALRWGIIVIVVLVIVFLGLGIWWSLQPPKFDVAGNTQGRTGEQGRQVPGSATVASAIEVGETLLGKPGGYLRNDVTPPGILMDNMPSWEYGLLTELRDSVRSLRNDFSRSQTQSIENEDLKTADSKFNFDAESWILPSAEEEYREGVAALQRYLNALASGDPRARFYARADNLRAYLMVVEKRLGSYGQRLSASVGDEELLAGLGVGDSAEASAESGADVTQPQGLQPTPWTEIDNVFFEARGYAWALLHMMKALAVDFAPVLQQKNAEVSMQQIIRDLEYATMRKWSPMVLNGHGFGLLANHSLVLASYMSRANAAVLDLRVLMERG